jgi:ubiquitin-protein ligase E3 A
MTRIIFGLVLCNGVLLNAKFPVTLYKKLLSKNLGFPDLKEFDPNLAQILEQLLKYEGNVEHDIKMVFEYNGIALISNGHLISVTNENRQDYVDRVINRLFNESVQQ